jgi:murein DD-endopeptidase MepM/ murein hydrolase activator NlpD
MRTETAISPCARALTRRGRRLRSVLSGVLVVVLAAAVVPNVAGAQTTDDEAKTAAREIQQARDRANAAAASFFEAQSDLELLQDDAHRLGLEADLLETVVEELRRDVEGIALARFVSSGTSGIPLLTGIQAPQDQVQAEIFFDVMSNSGSDTLDRFDLAQKDLTAKRSDLEDRRTEVEDAQVTFARLQDLANAEVERLREIEADRLQDEAVQKALAAQVAAERARIEEQFRREAEAAARALPNPGLEIPVTVATTTTVPVPITTPDGSIVVPDVPVTIAPTTTSPPVETLPTNSGASGGTSGGRTGTGGAGSTPTPIVLFNGGGYIDGIVCPMLGSAYGDSWGAPRSGGRRHEGVDMLAPAGTPIYAVVNGNVTFKQNRLGGNAVSLTGDNGTRYYYAHLSRYEGVSRRVIQGEIVGYNGDTGNATGVPHLHFEIHPGGGLAVNPTPSVRAAGC